MNASDADSHLNGEIEYSIMEKMVQNYFKIDKVTGEIYTITALDAEMFRSYSFTVMAKDHGEPPMNQTAIVNVCFFDLKVKIY